MSEELPQSTKALQRAHPLQIDKHTLSGVQLTCQGISGSQHGLSKGSNANERELSTDVEYRIHASISKLLVNLNCERGVDLRLSAALFHQDLSVAGCIQTEGHRSMFGCELHTREEEVHRGESMTANLKEMPLTIHHVLFTVSVVDEAQSLDEAMDVKVQLSEMELDLLPGVNVWSVPLKDAIGHAALAAVITRKGAYWHFQPLVKSVTGHNLETILQNPSNLSCLQKNPSSAPLIRKVKVRVVQGMDLAPKDRARLIRGPSSDPYYIIRFKGNMYKSRYQRRTLEPQWDQESPFDLGTLLETETESLEIEVFDHDSLSRDDFMGCICIPGNHVYEYGPGKHNLWYTLGSSQKEEFRDEKVSGKINLSFDIYDIS